MIKTLAGALYLLWAGGWFWAFCFAYSRGFFRYHAVARSLALAGAMSVILLCPLIARRQFLRFRSGALAWGDALFRSVLLTSATWVAFWVLFIVMIKFRALTGDDALGVGVDLALCFGALLATNALFAAALLLQRRRR